MRGLSIALILAFSSPAWAELHECNGTWTNKPCPGAVQHVLGESSAPPRTLKQKEQAQRELGLHDLEMKQLKAKRYYQLDLDISDVKLLCEKENVSLLTCKKAISDRKATIDERVLAAKQLKLKEQALKQKVNATPAAQNQVVIQEFNFRRHQRPTPQPPPILPQLPERRPGNLPPDEKHKSPTQ